VKKDKIRCRYQREDCPEQNGNDLFDLIFRLAHIRLFLLVLDTLSQSQQLGFDTVTIDHAKNRLRAGPAAPCTAAYCRHGENPQKEQHQQKRHQIKLLHIERHTCKMQLLMVKAQKKKVVSVDLDPGHHQCDNCHSKIEPIPLDTIGYPPL